MTPKLRIKKPKVIILDIEGTTTPIDFVHETLFGYIREQIKNDWLKDNESKIVDLRQNLINDHESIIGTKLDNLDRCILELMGRDSKVASLKQIQAKIMKDGYKRGLLKSELFNDVKSCIEEWKGANIKISIYSSGSVEAQQLLFANTNFGDMTGLIDTFFDTRIGSKLESSSYLEILKQIGVRIDSPVDDVVFVTDNLNEVKAATIAGITAIHIYRPGNEPIPSNLNDCCVKCICSFAELEFV